MTGGSTALPADSGGRRNMLERVVALATLFLFGIFSATIDKRPAAFVASATSTA